MSISKTSVAFLIVPVLIFLLLSPAAKGTIVVNYKGKNAGFETERQYLYEVITEKEEYLLTEFRVGVGDLDIKNYTHLLTPEKWNVEINFDVPLGCYGGCTPIGDEANLLRHLTYQSIRWWTEDPKNGVASFNFGFDHESQPGDVGWHLLNEKSETFTETTFIVGLGDGPVWGPDAAALPEPATLLLMGLGLLPLIRQKKFLN